MRIHALRRGSQVEIIRERVSRSGHPYAQRLNPLRHGWEYLGQRGLAGLSDATLLDLETARQYGLTYGVCAVCGALLTAHDSVASGIGPVCAEKLGIARNGTSPAPTEARTGAFEPTEAVGGRAWVADGLIVVDSPYDAQLVQEMRGIPGRRWTGRYNTFPLAAVTRVTRLCEQWGIDASALASIPPTEGLEVTTSEAPDLDVPSHLEGLMPFQRAGVAYTLGKRRVLIADEPGLGKTIQALAALDMAGAFPAVVVVPETLRTNWQREAARWLPHRTVEIARTRTPGMLTADIIVIGYAVVSAWQEHLTARGVAALVVDEAHACKNRTAQRTKAVRALAKNVRPDGLIMLLTGTPILNRPAELVSPLQILGVIREWGGVRGFLRQHCGTPDPWGHWSGARNLDALNRRLRATCMIRREKTEVLADLPPKRWAQIVVEHSDLADYRRAEREFLDWLAEHVGEEERDEKVAAALRAEVLVRLTALRKHAALGKLDAARQWTEDFRESGRPLVVSAHHREVLETLARDLDAPVIMGGQSEQARQEAIDRFQRGDADVIVVGITAGGVGITLHRSSDVLILERPWTWAALEQMADRVHRIGQDRPVTVWLMDAEGTVDERLATMINEKRRIGDEAIAARVLRGEW